MEINRRDFFKTVAAAVVLPVVGGNPAPNWAVDRRNMWAHDLTSEETLVRCDRILATNPDDVLALCHRGQVSPFVRAKHHADADLTRAISLETSPALLYIRGVTFDRSSDLQHAINMLTAVGEISGKALCTSIPDIYDWSGNGNGELLYLTYRELGSVLEDQGQHDKALGAFNVVASFQSISQADLERWTISDMQMGRLCEGVVGCRRLIQMDQKADYFEWLDECQRWLRVPKSVW